MKISFNTIPGIANKRQYRKEARRCSPRKFSFPSWK
jgi:hypothetical protein